MAFLAPAEETQSDYDDYSIQEESGAETTEEVTSYSSSPTSALTHEWRVTEAEETPNTPTAKASEIVAGGKGLKVVAVAHSERGNRHSKMMGARLVSPLDIPTSPSRTCT